MVRVSRYLLLLLLPLGAVFADSTTVLFDPLRPDVGPFPSDALTVSDAAQLTGRRVNLPLPDCVTQPALFAQLNLVNQLDGFSVQPRITVAFSGPIDTTTLRAGLFFSPADQPDQRIAVNQIAWDPATNMAYAKPDASLDQHRRYLLVVTDAIQDTAGNAVAADPVFGACLQSSDPGYCGDLAQVITDPSHVVAATLFTTQSATAWLESARKQLQSMPVVVRHPDGTFVFDISKISDLTVNFDAGSGVLLSSSLPIGDPSYALLFGNLGRLAFGSYLSPQVLNPQQTIDPSPTGSEVAIPTPVNEVAFHVYLPNPPAPPNGYPVVIFGHAFSDSSIGGPTIVAPRMALDGFATIAINAFGHGFGPQSSIAITDANGATTTLPLGGRGIDRNGDGLIDSTEGCVVLSPTPLGLRDCLRQTTVDLLQLVRVIQSGLDVDGDGTPDLDANRIYYAGESLGSIYGTLLTAVEPAVRAVVLNVGGGSVVDIVRWSPSFADTAATMLTSQTPPLQPVGTPFIDDFPFRDQPVSVNPPGASDTQYLMELIEWLDNAGDPIAFAPHLQRSPLSGMMPKPVLIQIARGDQVVSNPTSSNLVRTAGLESSTWLYRHDLARAQFPGLLPEDPHSYLALFLGVSGGTINLPSLPAILIGLSAQSQISGFFLSDGTMIPDMNQIFPGPLFEIPTTLPNDLGPSVTTTHQTVAIPRITTTESRLPYLLKRPAPAGKRFPSSQVK